MSMDLNAVSFCVNDDLTFNHDDKVTLSAALRKIADRLDDNPGIYANVAITTFDTNSGNTDVFSGYRGFILNGAGYDEGECYTVVGDNALFNALSSAHNMSFDDRQASGNAFDANDNTLDIWVGGAREDEDNLISISVGESV